MTRLRVGFIGFGRFARLRKQIIKDLKISNVVIEGYYDPNVDLSGELKRFKSDDDLYENCDAILISVPPKFAPIYTAKALNEKKHVFCEKPAATNSHALKSVAAARAQCTETVLGYGFNHRRHRSLIKIKEFTESKEFGSLLWMRGRYGKEVGKGYTNAWRSDIDQNGGGILIDQGIHMIDLMNWIAEGFDVFTAVLSTGYFNVDGVEDNAFVTMANSQTKVAASIHSTITQWRYLFALELFYERGSVVLNGLRTSSGVYGNEELTIRPSKEFEREFDTQKIEYSANHSWEDEMCAFFSAINSRADYPYSGLQDAVETTKLMDEIYERAIWI